MKSTRESLAALRRRARIGIAAEAAGCLAVLLLGYGLCSYTLDRWLELEREYRAGLLLGLLAVGVWLTYRRLWLPLRCTLGDDELAMAVERRDPQLRQALVSAVEFDQQLREGQDRGESQSMMRSVVDSLQRQDVRYLQALEGRRVLGFLALLGVTLAAAATWFATDGSEARIWAERNLALSDRAWPRSTTLHWVEAEGTLRIAEREDLRLRVDAEGEVPDRVRLRGRFADGQVIERDLDRIGARRFATTLETLLDDLEVVARGGDGETPPLRIELVARPRVTELRVRVEYPAYIGRRPEQLDSGELRVPRGSRLRLALVSDKPLIRAELSFEQATRLDAELSEDRLSAGVDFVAEQSGELRFELLDEDQLGPVAAPQLSLEVLPDTPPELDFETRGIGAAITAEARIPGRLLLRDDYGLDSVNATFRLRTATISGEGQVDPPFAPAPIAWLDPFRAGAREAELDLVFDLRDLRSPPTTQPPSVQPPTTGPTIRPGMLLTLRYEAADNHQPEAQIATAEDVHLRIVSREELLEDLQRRQLEQRGELAAVLEIELDARSTLSDLLASSAEDPRAEEAALRARSLSRQQLSLAERVRGIAARYRLVVDEIENNRLLEAALTRDLRRQIVDPLDHLGAALLPGSSTLVDRFADSGAESDRAEALAAFDGIIDRIRTLLARMERSENLTALIDALRGIIRAEDEISARLELLLREAMSDIFDEPPEEAQGR